MILNKILFVAVFGLVELSVYLLFFEDVNKRPVFFCFKLEEIYVSDCSFQHYRVTDQTRLLRLKFQSPLCSRNGDVD